MSHVTGDRETDAMYVGLRGRYAADNAKANGYRSQAWFRREQQLVLDAVGDGNGVVVDVGCGSGLMLQPLVGKRPVVGVDFNVDACHAATRAGLTVIRGDAFGLPFADDSIDVAISCQFFNQQSPEGVHKCVAEIARCLRPGGHAVLVWRNGQAWIHRIAHTLLSLVDKIVRRPTFANVNHPLDVVTTVAQRHGLQLSRGEVSLPLLRWSASSQSRFARNTWGASWVAVLAKSQSQARPSPSNT